MSTADHLIKLAAEKSKDAEQQVQARDTAQQQQIADLKQQLAAQKQQTAAQTQQLAAQTQQLATQTQQLVEQNRQIQELQLTLTQAHGAPPRKLSAAAPVGKLCKPSQAIIATKRFKKSLSFKVDDDGKTTRFELDENMQQVMVTDLGGEMTVDMELPSTDTILDVKREVQKREGVRTSDQTLCGAASGELSHDQVLRDVATAEGSVGNVLEICVVLEGSVA